MNRITLGKYSKRLVLQSPGTPAPDPGGDPRPAWTSRTIVYAEIVPLSGRELFNAQQLKVEIDTRIRFRFLDGIDATWQGLWQGQTFGFVSVLDRDNRRIELEILAISTPAPLAT